MKNIFLVFLTIFLCFGTQFNAQNNQNLYSDELQLAFSNRSEDEMKISTNLFTQIFRYNKAISVGISKNEAMKNFNPKFNKVDNQNRLFIMIRFKPGILSETEKVKNIVLNSGGVNSSVEIGHNGCTEIYCWMPIEKIINVTSNPGVGFIQTVYSSITNITTAGDVQLKAADVRSSMNVTGEGNKIGVMSDGAKNWWDATQAFELSSVNVLQTGDPEENEGTAMLEIIYDLAPGAQLYFSGLGDYNGNLSVRAQRISELENYGCNIVVDDIWNPTEPFFTDETVLGTAIRNFINNGNVYITAAGNYRNSCLSGTTLFSNLYHLFPSGLDYYPITIGNNGDIVLLQWATSWSVPTEDLDLEIYNMSNQLVYYSNNTQSSTVPPYEIVQIPQGSYKIKIKRKSASDGVNIKLVSPHTDFVSGSMTNQIFGISGYPNVISVAAYQADNQNNTSGYSSIGPAIMYSAALQQWTTQQVPTITATSGVETWVGVTNLWPDGNPVFSGTSASAPHIAGLAALYFHKLNGVDNLNKTNLDFINDLTQSAVTIESGTTGGTWNNKSGFGKADILAAINRSLQTVATPVLTPAGGTYPPPQTISITCATTGATIYYTVNGTEPSQTNGTLYTTTFTINTNMTIKARAFKTGYTASSTRTEVYTFSTQQAVATVTPVSGAYPVPLTVTISWPSGGYECYKTERFDGSEPPDPQNVGNYASRVWYNPSSEIHPYVELYKLKVQLKKDGQWGPVVYVQYDIRPSLRIAQIDDEISGNDNSFGFWNLWENNQWISYPDKLFARPTTTIDYFLQAQQDYKFNTYRKYNVWSKNSGENYVINHAQIPVGSNTSSVLAHFKNTYNATVTNKLEGGFSLNQGSFFFKDPWFIDDNSDPKGLRNRGTNPLTPVSIDFKNTPNITTDSDHKGVFLNQGGVPPNLTPPYYSVKANQTQSINLGGTIGTRYCYFQNWSADPSISASFQNSNSLETPVVFKSNGATVQANYKVHLLSNSTSATTSNNQRKIVQGSNGYWAMVYVSMNQVWLSRSIDGINWDREILISDYDNGYVNGYPSIDFYNDYAYIVWQSISWFGGGGWDICDINLRRYDLTNNTLGPIITAASFEPNIEAFISAPVIAYPGGKGNDITIAWREPNGIKIKDGGGQLGNDDITWRNTFSVPGTNSYCTNPSIAYASGNNFALCWAQSSNGNKIYYTTATENYNPEWTFGATELISPSDWQSNVSPQITVINRYKPTIAWSSWNNIVEGRSSVHIRQRSGLDVNDTWGNITSFSPGTPGNPSPVIGDYYGLNKMNVLWIIAKYIYNAYYDGSSWSGTTSSTTGFDSGININRTSPYQTKAIRKKSDNSISFKDIGGTAPPSKIVANSENEPAKFPYRLNRHAIIELPKDIDSTAKGSVCFEIAGISTLYNDSETKINYSPDENNLLSSKPFKVTAPGMQLSFAGAIYGAGLELPDKFISTINEPLTKVVLKDSKTNEVIQNIWINNAAMLNKVQNKTFGEFRNISVDLNKYLGKTVYVQVEMIGKAKNVKPLIVDDYLILTDSLSIAKSLGKKNLTAYELPTDYTLMQNYPNPFNPVTTISFFIPQNNYVTLKIYNTLGEEVMTAINEEMEEGYHSVNLNLSAMPSGVYLYSLSADSFRDTKKLLLLK